MFRAVLGFAILASLAGGAMQKPLSQEEIDRLNKRCYDARADYWSRLPFADFLPQAILKAHQPDSGWKAIDIGSGTGSLVMWLTNHHYKVLCLDPSDEMVRRTRSLGLETLQTTIQQFSTEEKFDLVVAVLSLIHVPKVEMPTQMDKIASLLNPGGVLALAMIEGNGEGVGETSSSYPRYFSYYTRQEVLELTKGHFSLIEEKRLAGPVTYLIFLFRKN